MAVHHLHHNDDDANWRTPGGSVQAVLTRWVRDDGAVFTGDTMTLAEVANTSDQRTVMFQACRPDPEFDVFALGGVLLEDDNGSPVGAAHPDGLVSPYTFSAEFWSLNIHNGSVIGYWHWTLPACSNFHYTGATLAGDAVALMTYRATADAPLTYELCEKLPDYTIGVTAS